MATKADEEIEILAKQARSGDRGAFSKIVRLTMNQITALTYRMTGDSDTAQDLAQDSFVAAWEKLPTFRGQAKFTSWLNQIAVNKSLNYLNLASTRRNQPLENSRADIFEASASAQNPERALGVKLLRRNIREFMNGLPEMQRAAFELRFYQGLSFGEIAAQLNKAEGTVKTHYRQAVLKLRQLATEKGWVS
jgi:RNA polymerase sigma-70 factor (ECF subfamily)